MANFIGGSAYSMASQIGEGYLLVNPSNLKKLSRGELGQLAFELNKILTEVRGNQPSLDDQPAQQLRNRKLSRLQGALMVINNQLASK